MRLLGPSVGVPSSSTIFLCFDFMFYFSFVFISLFYIAPNSCSSSYSSICLLPATHRRHKRLSSFRTVSYSSCRYRYTPVFHSRYFNSSQASLLEYSCLIISCYVVLLLYRCVCVCVDFYSCFVRRGFDYSF